MFHCILLVKVYAPWKSIVTPKASQHGTILIDTSLTMALTSATELTNLAALSDRHAAIRTATDNGANTCIAPQMATRNQYFMNTRLRGANESRSGGDMKHDEHVRKQLGP